MYFKVKEKQLTRSFLLALVAVWFCLLQPGSLYARDPFPKDSVKKGNAVSKMPDEKFAKSWKAFVQAVNANNMNSIKALSTSCVYCNYCLYNSDKENQSFVDSMKKDADAWTAKVNSELQYLPVNKFLQEDFTDIFSAETKPKLLDKANLAFGDGEENRKVYRKICISDKPISGKQKIVEVTVNSRSTKQRLNKTFTFIEDKDGYKFCGFSAIP